MGFRTYLEESTLDSNITKEEFTLIKKELAKYKVKAKKGKNDIWGEGQRIPEGDTLMVTIEKKKDKKGVLSWKLEVTSEESDNETGSNLVNSWGSGEIKSNEDSIDWLTLKGEGLFNALKDTF